LGSGRSGKKIDMGPLVGVERFSDNAEGTREWRVEHSWDYA
jgi:hypothetical protein